MYIVHQIQIKLWSETEGNFDVLGSAMASDVGESVLEITCWSLVVLGRLALDDMYSSQAVALEHHPTPMNLTNANTAHRPYKTL